jgi:hypothetical protein
VARIVKNLSLDPEAVRRGEKYSERHSTSVSQLVSDFLSGLPAEGDGVNLAPAVGRLLGLARGGGEAAYRKYLEKKYGK